MFAERQNRRTGRPLRGRTQLPFATFPLILALTAPAAAQWDPQAPAPPHLDVHGVGAPTPSHVFIATDDDNFDDGGALFASTDGGATWVQRDVPESGGSPLNGAFFLDDLNGWVYGNENARTTNGGATWTPLPLLGSIYRMTFHTPTFGLAFGGNQFNYVSHDAGNSWVDAPNGIFAFDFGDATTGVGVSGTGLYRTTDGGATVTPVLTGDADAIAFLSPTVAVAIVDDAFTRSTDGGATWTSGAAAEGRTTLVQVSANVALAWGRTGIFPNFDDRIFRSDDAGQTWTDLGEPIDVSTFSNGFAFGVADEQTVVVSDGSGGMHQSTDAGATWAQTFASIGMQPSFLSSAVPVFADAQTGYYGYGAGFVIKTTDGGASWTQISSGTGQSLNDIARFANGDMLAVGDGGTLLASDGSSPWTIQPTFTSSKVAALHVIGPQDVVAVDEPGRVYRSSDGGTSWTAGATTPSSLDAADLHFDTLLDGWIIGSGFGAGALFHTTNGGDSWTPVTSFLGGYVAVDFDGAVGWAANVGGRHYRTTDAGATWEQLELPGSSISITDMEFFDVSTGYAVGRFGYAARTTDGGSTWQVLPTPNSSTMFTDIHLLGANELWLSTNDDVAYHSATGGLSWSVIPIDSRGFGNFSAITGVPGGDAWTAGFQGYIEHFTGPPPPPVNQPPAASFDFEAAGLTAVFTDTSHDPDGTIVGWAWTFGDSTTSTERNPVHTYASAGSYIVRLTVTDDDGDTGIGGRLVVVQPGPGGTFGDFTEVTPLDPLFVTPQDEDFWVVTTAPADYDGDGDLDVAVLGYYVVYNESVEDKLVLLRNDGAAGPEEWEFAYVDVPLNGISAGQSDLAWADVDGDGDQDLALGSDGVTVIYRNDAGTMVMTDTVLPAYWEDNDQADFDLNSLSWADYDNDGDPDLLVPSVFNFTTFVWETALMRNDGPNGTGGFTFTRSDPFAGTSHAQSAWADYDGDQDLDLFLVNLAPLTEDGFIRRYRNDGDGVFVGEDILGSLTVEHGEARWSDYDADGDLDILVAGNLGETDGTFTARALRVYRNDAETFAQIELLSCIPCDGWFDFNAAAWADYDTDGDVDILVSGSYNSGSQIEGRARIYDNVGGNFVDTGNDLPAPSASGSRGGTFSWLDLDGDGDLDYFIAGQYYVPGGNGLVEAQMHAYRNDATGENAPPSAASALVAQVAKGANTVLLSWDAASDDHTPSSALTYDLELFRGGVPVVDPRRVPEPGAVSAATGWNITDLVDGSYTWRIRAVDSAYNGGPIAQGAFVVGDATGVEITPSVPQSFAFPQAYPNPFRSATTFHFALPERADVNVSVYDVGGRLVTRLVNEPYAPGTYDVSWDPRGLASGTYFVRLSAGSFTKTQRVLLLK
jgi:photosystem II stability/assembly factor-like uncharacterized protein